MFEERRRADPGRPGRARSGRRHPEHRLAVGEHPGRRVGLLEPARERQVRPVEGTEVVETQEAAREQVVTGRVLPVEPPGEVHEQLVEDPLEELDVAPAIDLPDAERRQGVDRRIHVIERPLVGRQGPVRMLEPLPAQDEQLVLREGRIDVGEGHGVERQVPGREPRVLPGIRHRQDVERVDVAPAGVPTVKALAAAGSPGRPSASG